MYPNIMARHYNKNPINLALGGSGNYRTFDLFGQLDFSDANTAVVMQLAQPSRIRWYHPDKKCIHDQMLSQHPDRTLLTVYHDHFLLYDLIRQLRVVVNCCRASKTKLIIWSLVRFKDSELDSAVETYLSQFPEYVFVDPRVYRVDNGTDGPADVVDPDSPVGHPGPRSHSKLAQILIEHLDKLYH